MIFLLLLSSLGCLEGCDAKALDARSRIIVQARPVQYYGATPQSLTASSRTANNSWSCLPALLSVEEQLPQSAKSNLKRTFAQDLLQARPVTDLIGGQSAA